jgi:iron(III) transport system substrate-binding protein
MRATTTFLCLFFLLAASLTGAGCTPGKKKLWIYSSLYKEVIEEMKAPLQAAVPGVEIEWFQGGSESIASKVSAELAAGKPKADLILTSDPFWYEELKRAGKLLAYASPAAREVPGRYLDKDAAYAGARLPVMVIGYNSEALKADEAPKSWAELLEPKWKGKVTMPSPLESGTAFTTVALLSRKLGWDYFRKLREHDLLAAGGNSSVINRLETRERVVGIVLLENLLKARAKGSPVRPAYPEDGVIPILSPVAILKDTSQPEEARKAYDWFFTPQAQAAIVRSGMYSPFPGAPIPENALALKELEPRMMPWSPEILAELFSQRDSIKARFTELVLR